MDNQRNSIIGLTATRESIWSPPPHPLSLNDDEVHVWRVPLDLPASNIPAFLDLLEDDDLRRARRFRFQQNHNCFVVARGMLRLILGLYLDQEPSALRFVYGQYGKPALFGGANEMGICFNVSHSHHLALIAVTRRREVGLDIEYVRADFASKELAERFFSRREAAVLCGLPTEAQTLAFFNCWTRKEAYLKALGVGLATRLDQFDVSLKPGEPAALVCDRQCPHAPTQWALRELYPGCGYVAAVASKGHDWHLKCWQWKRALSIDGIYSA